MKVLIFAAGITAGFLISTEEDSVLTFLQALNKRMMAASARSDFFITGSFICIQNKTNY
jgi:hypothetical protein